MIAYQILGWGLILPLIRVNAINITSAEIFTENGWTTVTVADTNLSEGIAARNVVLNTDVAGLVNGKAYLVKIYGSVA